MPQKAVPVSTGYCVCFVNPRPGNYWGGKEIKFSLMFAEIKVFFLFFYLFGWSQSRLRSLNISAPDPLENCSATRVFQFWYSITHKKKLITAWDCCALEKYGTVPVIEYSIHLRRVMSRILPFFYTTIQVITSTGISLSASLSLIWFLFLFIGIPKAV